MSRLSYWRPQVLLPWQTYRVVLKRSPQDYSQSLCDEVQLCSHCTTEVMTHSSFRRHSPTRAGGQCQHAAGAQPWGFLAGRLESGKIPKIKKQTLCLPFFLNKSSRPRRHQKKTPSLVHQLFCLSQSSLQCRLVNPVPIFTGSGTFLWMSHLNKQIVWHLIKVLSFSNFVFSFNYFSLRENMFTT